MYVYLYVLGKNQGMPLLVTIYLTGARKREKTSML